MTENYKIAKQLINKGYAKKHYTFNETGRIILNLVDLSGRWIGYIEPDDEYVNVTLNNEYIGSLSISLRYMCIGCLRIKHV